MADYAQRVTAGKERNAQHMHKFGNKPTVYMNKSNCNYLLLHKGDERGHRISSIGKRN